ncbi:MAG TPA: 16S rRNA (cytosine(967)-C(5))-methyltransferase RsmB [Alphaproteobacteria bacterium]|nr:16S rRNA (cytosine(967)-C(5))-methyltransferase RsmB [Alphaproteobacteria bacterium]
MSDTVIDNGLQTRKIAYHILCEVLLRKTPLDQVLARHGEFNGLEEARDRAFVRMLVATCLRRKGQIDDLIRRTVDKDREIHPQSLGVILSIGVCQVIFMNVPSHAAVDTTVNLAEAENMSRQKGFINAVLRRMTSEGQEWVKKQDAVQMNMPSWLLRQWIDDYGLSGAAEIAQGSLAEAPTDISIKNQNEENYWAGELDASVLPTGSLRRSGGGNVTDLKGFDDGAWWVQDASAALPAKVLGDISGKTVIDLCAAPGGKTAQLAAGGAQVIAVDRSAKRLATLKENMDRLQLADHVEVVASDGGVWQPPAPVDVVLLDAPCTATGMIRRHPDVMHLKGERDLAQLCDLQSRLLNNAAAMVKAGGMLVYCTCSLQKAEGEQQINTFLLSHSDFERKPISAREIGGLEDLVTADGDLRVLPYHLAPQGGMDGFYVARLIKKN